MRQLAYSVRPGFTRALTDPGLKRRLGAKNPNFFHFLLDKCLIKCYNYSRKIEQLVERHVASRFV